VGFSADYSVRSDRYRCEAARPDDVASELNDLPDGKGGYRLIARRDVFAIAERTVQEGSSLAAVQLHVAHIA
jgi:hypothetical protein